MDYLLADNAWRPLIGARWIWVISAAHLLGCWLSFHAGSQNRLKRDGKPDLIAQMFWIMLSVFMFVLFLNKFLDLQSLLTVSLRNSARAEGWFSDRKRVQFDFIVASAVLGMICLAISFIILRGRWRQCGLALCAAVFLLILILIRMPSYYVIDKLLYALPVVGNRMNAGLELAGALLVCLGARQASRPSTLQRVVGDDSKLLTQQVTPT